MSVHPSVFIEYEMLAHGWDRDDLATHMVGAVGGEEWSLVRLALDFYLDIGADTPGLRIGEAAENFARAFGTSPEFWTNLEAEWLKEARDD